MSIFHLKVHLLMLVCVISFINAALNASRSAEILKKFDRRKSILAPREKGNQIDVSLHVHIQNMVPLTFINNHIFVEMDIATLWKDEHLKYEAHSPNDMLILQGEGSDSIWRPDIVIANEKGNEHETFPETLATCLISPSGEVLFSKRVSITVFCPMSNVAFPFDKQVCHLRFESYTYNSSQLKLKFLNSSRGSPISFSQSFKISKFILDKYTSDMRVINYGISGHFDQIGINFFLKRDIRFYIMEYYFPIICVVFLSFISFWIAHESTPARVALPVTTFLTLTAMLDHVRISSNIFGTADALEVFLNVSIFFIFGVMVEYGIVEAIASQLDKQTRSRGRRNAHGVRVEDEHSSTARQFMQRFKAYCARKFIRASDGTISVDRFCRYLFPLSYFSFLLLYFTASIVALNSD